MSQIRDQITGVYQAIDGERGAREREIVAANQAAEAARVEAEKATAAAEAATAAAAASRRKVKWTRRFAVLALLAAIIGIGVGVKGNRSARDASTAAKTANEALDKIEEDRLARSRGSCNNDNAAKQASRDSYDDIFAGQVNIANSGVETLEQLLTSNATQEQRERTHAFVMAYEANVAREAEAQKAIAKAKVGFLDPDHPDQIIPTRDCTDKGIAKYLAATAPPATTTTTGGP
jgi:hypothetical protein